MTTSLAAIRRRKSGALKIHTAPNQAQSPSPAESSEPSPSPDDCTPPLVRQGWAGRLVQIEVRNHIDKYFNGTTSNFTLDLKKRLVGSRRFIFPLGLLRSYRVFIVESRFFSLNVFVLD